jgi:hypothetical protein
MRIKRSPEGAKDRIVSPLPGLFSPFSGSGGSLRSPPAVCLAPLQGAKSAFEKPPAGCPYGSNDGEKYAALAGTAALTGKSCKKKSEAFFLPTTIGFYIPVTDESR